MPLEGIDAPTLSECGRCSAKLPPIQVLEPLPETGSSSVALLEVTRIAFASLLSNKVRSLLTMLGVIIGVASVIALLALGRGASSAITERITSSGTNLLTIQPGAPSNRGPGGGGPGGGGGQVQTLTLADADAVRALNLPVNGIATVF